MSDLGRIMGAMSAFAGRPGLRWLVPVAAAGLIVTGALAAPRMVLAGLQLPARTADELLVDIQQAQPSPLSGTIAISAELGLPKLPAQAGASDSPAALLTGDHTLRVWLDGRSRQRLALLGPGTEKVLVRNGTDLWAWSSARATADHVVLPEDGSDPEAAGSDLDQLSGMPLPATPQEAAEVVLATLDPTTEVSVSGTARVAGRDAYQLVLAPRDPSTLVDRVVLSVDAVTSTLLRTEVFSTTLADPALSVGFSSVEFGTPDAQLFQFQPPPGATVTEHSAEELAEAHEQGPGGDAAGGPWVAFGTQSPLGELPEPEVVGSGWSRVVVATLPDDSLADLAEQGSKAQGSGDGTSEPGGDDASEPADGAAASALALLGLLPTTSGSWGSGKVLAGTLFTVIVTDDGRVAAGAVPPEVVGDALASTS